MRKTLLLLIAIFGTASLCRAQGIPFAVNPPAPNATMTVCSAPANGNPCTNTVTVYSTVALSQTIAQPIQIGPTGAYTFFYNGALASIVIQITGRVDQIVSGGGGGLPSGCTSPAVGQLNCTSSV